MPDFKATDRFDTSDDALIRELDGESVILDLSSEQYFGLDDVGTLIWHRFEAGDSLADVLQAMTAEFEVDEDTAREDLNAFTDQLVEAGLMTKR